MEYTDNYILWLQSMSEQDPDYIVDILGITTAELLDTFSNKAFNYYKDTEEDED